MFLCRLFAENLLLLTPKLMKNWPKKFTTVQNLSISELKLETQWLRMTFTKVQLQAHSVLTGTIIFEIWDFMFDSELESKSILSKKLSTYSKTLKSVIFSFRWSITEWLGEGTLF